MKRWRLFFEWRDLWVGVYVDNAFMPGIDRWPRWRRGVYICVLPTVVLYLPLDHCRDCGARWRCDVEADHLPF